MSAKEPEIIIVKIGDREFRTAFDSRGIQRCLPHDEGNPELTECLRPFQEYYSEGGGYEKTRIAFDGYDTGNMYNDMRAGRWTLDEVLSYDTSRGWGIDGLRWMPIYSESFEFYNPVDYEKKED